GSHRAVLDGLVERIDARWTLMTLPARKWKWRMRGSAIGFATSLAEEHNAAGAVGRRPLYDLVFASTFVNLAELYGMAGEALAGVPSIVYFHENQLVYPNRHTAEWDYQFPLTNITTALTADACVFNTEWNMRTFLDEIPDFIRAFPDHRPTGLADRIAARSAVIPPPFDPTPFDAALERGVAANCRDDARVRIVWPHRWEHDKNPEAFLAAVTVLAAEGLPFEVAVAGQEFRETSGLLRDAANALGDRLVHVGQPDTRAAYAELLATSDIAVSTAYNEFFGLAMIEASYAGCFPLVPDRLAYPEIYPSEFLYADDDALVFRLRELILDRPASARARAIADRFTFDRCVPSYENLFDTVAR
ncbi:MAG: DUF3524 domain-containing protein, partial [Coriobacteriia bacterium]|nr:DUF3524 domain-containing protein [Coriobacteriia bacterium]